MRVGCWLYSKVLTWFPDDPRPQSRALAVRKGENRCTCSVTVKDQHERCRSYNSQNRAAGVSAAPRLCSQGGQAQRAAEQVRKERGRVVQRHLLVVERQAEETAAQQVPPVRHRRRRARLQAWQLRVWGFVPESALVHACVTQGRGSPQGLSCYLGGRHEAAVTSCAAGPGKGHEICLPNMIGRQGQHRQSQA